jgi:hypothetical protein
MIVERWDNRYQRRAVVHMDFHDIQHFKAWLEIEMGRRPFPRLKTMIQDIQEIFPGAQMKDILDGLYRYY